MRSTRASTSSLLPRPNSICAPLLSSARQLPRAVSSKPLIWNCNFPSSGFKTSYICSTCADSESGPLKRGKFSSSNSPKFALKTSPCLFNSRESASLPQNAAGWCSSISTLSLFGNSRLTKACLTQGTFSKVARACIKSTVKKPPRNRGTTLALNVTALL